MKDNLLQFRLVLTIDKIKRINVHFPTQKRFPIGGERVTCCGLKLTNNNLNFGLARDQVVHI